MAIDPSGRGSDETGIAIVRSLLGKLYLVYSGGLTGGSTEENLQAIADLAKEYKVNSIVLEVNFGDGMYGQLLKPYITKTWPCSLEDTRATGQKEARIIHTLEPVMQQHRLIVDRKVVERDLKSLPKHSLFYQMTRLNALPKCLQHDDRLDALEMAVAYWLSQMSVDEKDAAKAHLDELLDADLDAFIEGGPLVVHGVESLWKPNASSHGMLGMSDYRL
jgi:hypothetical protein